MMRAFVAEAAFEEGPADTACARFGLHERHECAAHPAAARVRINHKVCDDDMRVGRLQLPHGDRRALQRAGLIVGGGQADAGIIRNRRAFTRDQLDGVGGPLLSVEGEGLLDFAVGDVARVEADALADPTPDAFKILSAIDPTELGVT